MSSYKYSLHVLVEGSWSLELQTDAPQELVPADAVLQLLDSYASSINHSVPCAHCNTRRTFLGVKCLLMQHVVRHPGGCKIHKVWGAVGFSCLDKQACVHAVATRVRVHWKAAMADLKAEGESGTMFRVCHACRTSEANAPVGAPKFRVCGRCKNVHYCSTECQRNDWPQHKRWCGPG